MWVGGRLLPGAKAFVDYLEAAGCHVRYLTNTSSSTGADLAKTLSALGIPTPATHVFAPLDALQHLEVLRTAQPVFALGSPRLSEVLEAGGVEVVRELESAGTANSVVLGRYSNLTLAHLEAAANIIWRGGLLIALNADPRVPAQEGRILVGVGAVVACLELAANAEALVIGKPSATFFEAALETFGATAGTTTMIGDSIKADIQGAKQLGMRTVYLGPEGDGQLADARADNLAELLTNMRQAEGSWRSR